MTGAFFILIALIYVRSVRNLFHLIKNTSWITKMTSRFALKSSPKTSFIVCIPAYKEQATIIETMEYFLALDYPPEKLRFIIATTQKEADSKTSTRQIVEKYINSQKISSQKRLRIIHYPKTNGLMAHQINFAAKSIKKELTSAYFVVYNADSRPDKKTFRYVDAAIENYKKQYTVYPTILQQSALFNSTRSQHQSTASYLLGMGTALHQSLWTLTQEITRFKNQSIHTPKLRKKNNIFNTLLHARYAHSVGHGLFIKGSHYLSNMLPENVLNEDMPYGLLQSSLRNAIYPIPLLEVASSPSRITNVYKQKSVWFNPFFEYHIALSTIIKNNQYESLIEVYFLTLQAYISLLIWLFHSSIWIVSLILSIALGAPYFALWVIGLVLYWFIPSFIAKSFIERNTIPINVKVSSIFIGTIYVLTHSLGPLIATAKWTIAISRKSKPTKPKTENA